MEYLILLFAVGALLIFMYMMWRSVNETLEKVIKNLVRVEKEIIQLDIKWFASFNAMKCEAESIKTEIKVLKKEPISKPKPKTRKRTKK